MKKIKQFMNWLISGQVDYGFRKFHVEDVEIDTINLEVSPSGNIREFIKEIE